MRGLALLFTLHWGGGGGDHSGGDRWFSADKAKHFVTAAFVQSASFSALRLTGANRGNALAGATLVASATSVGKEVYDQHSGGTASAKDLSWDAAGIVAASALLVHTER